MQNRTRKYSKLPVVYESGIVFYVYSFDRCQSGKNYMSEVLYNAKEIRKKYSKVIFIESFHS